MKLSVFTLLVCFFLGSICRAQHADIEIAVEGGTLVTVPRIGEGEFGEAPNPANVADEPGFEIDDGVFNAGEQLGFNALSLDPDADGPIPGRNLWYWDGLGAVNFGVSSSDLAIEHPVTSAAISLNSSPGATTIPGFLIGFADSDGGLHQDLEFVLSTNPPAAGVYLFGLEMTSPSYGTSDPLYMVLAYDVDEAVHDAAVDWAADTFNVPEPSALVWTLLTSLLSLRSMRT